MTYFYFFGGCMLLFLFLIVYENFKRNFMKCSICHRYLNQVERVNGCIPCAMLERKFPLKGMIPEGTAPLRAFDLLPGDEFIKTGVRYVVTDKNKTVIRYKVTTNENGQLFFGVHSQEIVFKVLNLN